EYGEPFDLELQIETAKNKRLWVKALGQSRTLNAGTRTLFGTFQDITERKQSEEHVQYLAYYDALTGLPNRTLLADRLLKALATASRQKDKVALLFLDLDRFKSINDSFGHTFGDLVLQDVATRLEGRTRKQDTVGRLGGDEFLIVLNSVKDISDVAVAAKRFMDAMAAEFVVQGHSLGITCSLGVSIFPEHGTDVESLLKHADAAMYSAKENGRNSFQFFSEEMTAQVVERLTLENSLRPALEKKQLFLVYQPQMDLATGKIHLRLIDQKELFLLECRTQAVFQGQSLHNLSSHLFRKELKAVPSILFGAIHGRIGMLEQAFNIRTVFRENADAEAAGNAKGVTLDNEFSGHCVHKPLSRNCYIGDVLYTVEYDKEFVSAQAAHRVLFARPSLKSCRHILQD